MTSREQMGTEPPEPRWGQPVALLIPGGWRQFLMRDSHAAAS